MRLDYDAVFNHLDNKHIILDGSKLDEDVLEQGLHDAEVTRRWELSNSYNGLFYIESCDVMPVESQEELDELLADGYVISELYIEDGNLHYTVQEVEAKVTKMFHLKYRVDTGCSWKEDEALVVAEDEDSAIKILKASIKSLGNDYWPEKIEILGEFSGNIFSRLYGADIFIQKEENILKTLSRLS